ncbi:DNA polymerase I [Ilyobacter polytropus]|uniref:DNA polymerase I n=1 Tax=Ilyobacter polytropus (strain ATCC 51220 / DSM 2926 / LMG 16218 / CuHBu1) TaxID=572544 RepID=E3H7R7_ILYPC|nr:DNA polymerase I [Ilyobacter polytropus]ADO82649.1 DNA polymerase I [Ilyobacter polytropus DSM 2926]
MKRAVLLDVSAIMYRAFFAHMNFKTKNEPTGAVFGFTNTLLSIIDEFSPDYIGAAFDVKRSTLKRSEKYKDYKSARKPIPEDLVTQIPRIEDLLDCFGIEKFKIDGHEADDVIGALAKKLSADNIEVYIITGDKDLSQLVDDNINIALLGKGEGKERFKILRTEEDVVEQLGVKPNDIPDLFGLIGDASDGIPGVRKIGSKKALVMLQKYKNLEGVYNHIDELSDLPGIGKGLVKNIEEDKDLAFLSRDLATIDLEIPVDYDPHKLQHGIEKNRLYNLFKNLEFKALIKKLNLKEQEPEKEALEEHKKNSSKENKQMSLFGGKVSEEIVVERENKIITTEDMFEDMLKKAKSEKIAAILYGDCGISVTLKSGNYYMPLSHDYIGSENNSIELLKKFLSADIEFISYKFKDILNEGYEIKNIHFDVMIAYFLLTAQTKESIEVVLHNETGDDFPLYKDIFGKEDPSKLPVEEYGEFMMKRSESLYDIYKDLKNRIELEDMHDLFYNVEMKLILILSKMEQEGIAIDPEYFREFSLELSDKLQELKKNIFKISEEEFNLNSPKQLAEILFMKLNIEPVSKTKTGFSTNVDVLETLRDRGEKIAEYILDYRKLTKLQSTYVDALPKLADERNRLHTTFNQTGAATGRLSSSNPNLQNIPVKSDEGIKIRRGFISDKGNTLLAIDYSQIELRVLAELSKDETLIKAYSDGLDLHDLTAKKIFDIDTDVTRSQRTMAKIVNFSIIYGKTPFGLSKELGISQKDAKEYIKRYFEQYPRVKELEEKIIKNAEETGYVKTYFGRKRSVDGISSKNGNIKKQADRMAVNTVIQGTAADILKKVMIEIDKKIKDKNDIKMNLQVHDELIFEVKDESVEKYADLIKNIMENSIKFKNVKLEANVAQGKNWAEAK